MNVIWIISDTLRRDHLGCYGNPTIHTPALDALAQRSIQFGRHYIGSFPTVPARADYFTGRWAGSFMNWEPLPAGSVTVAQVLQQAGFTTAAVVDTPFYVRNGMNFDRGFSFFHEIPGQYGRDGSDRDAASRLEADCFAPRTFSRAMQWLEHHYKENFFLLVDAWDPHEPCDPPPYYTELYYPNYDGELVNPVYYYWQKKAGLTEEKVKKAHANYCGEITMVDTWCGYLLRRVENMGLLDRTAIIFTSDHGFYYGEHGGLFGKLTLIFSIVDGVEQNTAWGSSPLYEEVTATPLLIAAPNIGAGTYGGLTSAIDLAPTVLELAGVEAPASMEGRSLLPAMRDSSVPGREYVFSGLPFTNHGSTVAWVDDQPRTMEKDSSITVTSREWTLIYAVEPGGSELYHLPSDPHQENNVIHRQPEIAAELHRQLVKFMRATKVPERLLKPRLELR